MRTQYTALRRGELLTLQSTCKSAYGYLRYHADESVLIILNFAAEEQRGCAFSLSASPLIAGEYAVRALLKDLEVDQLPLGEGGSFTDYVPRDILPPRAAYILLIGSAS